MIKVHRFRLYPSRLTEQKLFSSFDRCRDVYNYCLETGVHDVRVLPKLKLEHPEFKEVHSIVLQNVVFQLQNNLHVLHALKVKGHHVGKLRFKKCFHSMTFEQTGFKVDGDTLVLSKIGRVCMSVSELLQGVVKQVIVKRNKTHKWFVCFVCEVSVESLKSISRKTIGIDLNVANFCTDSDGLVVEHPHNVKKAEERLVKQQQKLSRKKKGGYSRGKQKRRVALVHERVENRRNGFLRKLSRYCVNRYDLVSVEDLNIKGLVEINGSGVRKSMLDASWGKFLCYVGYKAENAGKCMVKVSPDGTIQMCS